MSVIGCPLNALMQYTYFCFITRFSSHSYVCLVILKPVIIQFLTCVCVYIHVCIYIYIYRCRGCLGYASVVMERLCDAQTFVVLLLSYRTYEMREWRYLTYISIITSNFYVWLFDWFWDHWDAWYLLRDLKCYSLWCHNSIVVWYY